MDFTIHERAWTICEMMDEFVQKELYLLEKDMDSGWPAFEKELKKNERRLSRWGCGLPTIRKKIGGMGLKLMKHAYVSEVLDQSLFGHYESLQGRIDY